jgi:hypothetical protein
VNDKLTKEEAETDIKKAPSSLLSDIDSDEDSGNDEGWQTHGIRFQHRPQEQRRYRQCNNSVTTV